MKERNYGIDLLRILSMFMVVLLHLCGFGGVLSNVKPFSVNYYIAWFLEIVSYCAVDVFALISGFVGVKSSFKYSNLAFLWVRVFFYSFGITLIFLIYDHNIVSFKDLIKSIFPVLSNQYWYFSAYFVLCLFIPLLNYILNNLERGVLLCSIVLVTSLLSFQQVVVRKDVFCVGKGYSPWWLLILYLIGGYIKIYLSKKKFLHKKLIIGYCTMILITLFSKIFIQYISIKVLGKNIDGGILIDYVSPTVIIASILLVLIFRNINFMGYSIKIISFFSPLAFSVYLIHNNNLINKYIIIDSLKQIVDLKWYLFVIVIMGSTICIYILCSMIDLIRVLLFKKFKVKKKIEFFGKRYQFLKCELRDRLS